MSATQREQIERALDELIASSPLRTTQQCQQLLRYIVRNTLEGEFSLLGERVIGKEVFGRRAAYDPGEDPVVRVRAADLRKRLALYYQSLSTAPEVRIEIPSGSYRANFLWQPEVTPEVGPTSTLGELVESVPRLVSAAVPLPAKQKASQIAPVLEPMAGPDVLAPRERWSRRTLVGIAFLLLAGLIAGVTWYKIHSEPVRTFWRPFLADSKPVMVSIGSNAVYRLEDARADEYAREMPAGNEGMEFYPVLQPRQTFESTGIHPTPDSFVALGDVAATSEIVRTLTRFGKDFEERFPNDISFAEVREHASVLIGGFNNPMTRELTRGLPFVMAHRNRIEDRDHPGNAWVLRASTDSHDTEDYAIVTRLVGGNGGSPLLSVAGLGQYGTVAATEFVCRPENLRVLVALAGDGWRRQNLQVVLRIKVRDFKPVTTSIVAVRLW